MMTRVHFKSIQLHEQGQYRIFTIIDKKETQEGEKCQTKTTIFSTLTYSSFLISILKLCVIVFLRISFVDFRSTCYLFFDFKIESSRGCLECGKNICYIWV